MDTVSGRTPEAPRATQIGSDTGGVDVQSLTADQRAQVEKLSMNLARAALTAQGAIAEMALRNADRPAALSPDPFHVAPALTEVMGRLAAQPDRLMRAQADLFARYLDLWQSTARRAAGEAAAPVAEPARGDKRFADPANAPTEDLRDIQHQTRKIFPDWHQEITSIRGGDNWAVFEWVGRATFNDSTPITMHGATILGGRGRVDGGPHQWMAKANPSTDLEQLFRLGAGSRPREGARRRQHHRRGPRGRAGGRRRGAGRPRHRRHPHAEAAARPHGSRAHVHHRPRGTVENRAQYLENRKARLVEFESLVPDEIKVRLYGDTALVTGRSTAKGKDHHGKMDDQRRWTRVLVRHDGRWQFVGYQGTPIPKP
jgi:hypothetical protein